MTPVFVCLAVTALAAPAGAEPVRLRVVSYNIHHGAGLDGKLDLARIGAILANANADLVALQEVERRTTRTSRVDQPAVLAQQTGLGGLFGRAIDFAGGEYGNALLARHPLAHPTVTPLPVHGEPRCCLRADIAVPGLAEPLVFMATHLDFEGDAAGQASRVRQIDAILAEAGKVPSDAAVILAGDLNCEPGSPPLARLLAAGWLEVTTANGPTCPADQPTAKIDHVYLRPGRREARVVSCAVIDEPVASDHRPIVAEIELRPLPPERAATQRPRAWGQIG